MISPETVKIADQLPEITKKLVEGRMRNAKARIELEKRYLADMERLSVEDGKIIAEHSQAARAKKQIDDEVPSEIYRLRDIAGAAFRNAASTIKYERDQRAAAAEALEGFKGMKEEREALAERLQAAQFALDRAEETLENLKKANERAEAAVETAYQKVRKEALAAKVERAGRG